MSAHDREAQVATSVLTVQKYADCTRPSADLVQKSYGLHKCFSLRFQIRYMLW